jgi:hypothetical protein
MRHQLEHGETAADVALRRVEAIIAKIPPLSRTTSQEAAPSPRPRLVFLGTHPRVFIDGLERDIPTQPLQLLMMLGKQVPKRGEFVSGAEIERRFSRRVPADLIRELKKVLNRHTSASESISIETRRNPLGYRLTLTVQEVLFLQESKPR